MHGISISPCIKSREYRLLPATVHVIVPPNCKNIKQVELIFLGTWPTVLIRSFTTLMTQMGHVYYPAPSSNKEFHQERDSIFPDTDDNL